MTFARNWKRYRPARSARRVRETKPDVVIEFPSIGATYFRHEYGVYAYDEYPASSVLAGQTRRRWLAAFPTLAEAQAAHPDARVATPGYAPPSLDHLPDDGE